MAKKRKPDRIIFDLTKYLFIITILLFLGAFIISMLTEPAEKKNKTETEPPSAFSETEEPKETSNSAVTLPDETDEPPVSEAEETTSETIKEIDNEWAMFLVNSVNPLPDNYDSLISTEVVFTNGDRDFSVDSRMAPYLTNMIEAAKADGIDLAVASAYRSMEYQQYNFDRSVQQRISDRGMTYDEAYTDTLKEVALPGVSEHNAGLAVDILSGEYYSFDDDGFKNTKAYAWLMEHAQEYGFILRYPEGKEDVTGIIYEPWHYRFVGVYYANKVKDSGLCLEEYYQEQGWAGSDGTATKMTVNG
ncbi:MAG: M15 family metallopeptidase [Oscillospiraceae bacterium]|nr:M15 family metallopeptidase [Oscillospiraceae bacterium]